MKKSTSPPDVPALWTEGRPVCRYYLNEDSVKASVKFNLLCRYQDHFGFRIFDFGFSNPQSTIRNPQYFKRLNILSAIIIACK
jgi:hypothetical protein